MSIYLNRIRRKVGFNYERNIALRLVLSLAGFYIGLHALYIIIMVLADNQNAVLHGYYLPNIGLQSLEILLQKPWIILSHFLYTMGFFELVTNMIWLYLFSSITQTLVGYKEIIPLFLISTIISAFGVMFINEFFPLGNYIITGSYAGIMGMAAACIVLAPNYKLYFSSSLAIPVWVFFVIYIILNGILLVNGNTPMMILLLLAFLVGAFYIILLKNGFQIGKSIYNFIGKFESWFGKNNAINKEGISASKLVLNKKQDNIDKILEKIHQKGFLSLTKEEKEELEQFSNNI